MKLNGNDMGPITAFINAVNEAEGQVWLESKNGDKLDLKSEFASIVAIGKLADDNSDLELYCSSPNDEQKFYSFFEYLRKRKKKANNEN